VEAVWWCYRPRGTAPPLKVARWARAACDALHGSVRPRGGNVLCAPPCMFHQGLSIESIRGRDGGYDFIAARPLARAPCAAVQLSTRFINISGVRPEKYKVSQWNPEQAAIYNQAIYN
jgi:hypothetical protein